MWTERNQKCPVPCTHGIHPRPEIPPTGTTCGDSTAAPAEAHRCLAAVAYDVSSRHVDTWGRSLRRRTQGRQGFTKPRVKKTLPIYQVLYAMRARGRSTGGSSPTASLPQLPDATPNFPDPFLSFQYSICCTLLIPLSRCLPHLFHPFCPSEPSKSHGVSRGLIISHAPG